MDRHFVDEINAQFASFDASFASTVVGLAFAQMVCDERKVHESRLHNDQLEAYVDKLQLDLERWQSVKNYLETGIFLGGNDDAALRKDMQKVEYVDDDMCMRILDNLVEEVNKADMPGVNLEIAEADTGIVAEEKATEKKTTKAAKKKASTTTFKIHPITKMTTRRRRVLKGLTLVNPIKYFDCLLCKAGFYKEVELRKHYCKKHRLDIGEAPLPTSDLHIECLEREPQSHKQCGKECFETDEDKNQCQ